MVDVGWCYVLEPPQAIRAVWQYRPWVGELVPTGFEYTSRMAARLTRDELLELVKA